jgi:pimeloyl-ACP methyl ester carboxylesterase
MQIVVDGLLTAYERRGEGRTVLLLHGWGDRAAGLGNLQAALSRRYDVIAPDLPGFGDTQAPPVTWGLDDYARFAVRFLEKLPIRQLYAIVAHSNGGAIAMRGLGQGTLRADRLVLLASAGVRDEYRGRVKALRYITKAGKVLTIPLPAPVRRKIRRKVYDAVGSDMLVAEHLQETFKRVVTDDVRADAARLSIPTLLIYGEADQATPIRYGELFHELIEGSTLEVLPSAGHFVHLDRPREVLTATEEFLR